MGFPTTHDKDSTSGEAARKAAAEPLRRTRALSEVARVKLTKLAEQYQRNHRVSFSRAWDLVTGEASLRTIDTPQRGVRYDPESVIRLNGIVDVVYELGVSFEDAQKVFWDDLNRRVAKVQAIQGVEYCEAKDFVIAELAKNQK